MLPENFQAPPELLKRALHKRATENPRGALASLAKTLGVSASFMSALASGRKKLSVKRALQLSYALKMDDEERDRFLHSVSLVAAFHHPNARRLAREYVRIRSLGENDPFENFVHITRDQELVLKQWYHIAILDLCGCAHFKPDVDWIAERLGLRPATVEQSLARLMRLGLLKFENGSWVKTSAHLSIRSDGALSAIRKFHRQMIRKAGQELSKTDERNFRRRKISGITLTVDSTRLDQAKTLIERFQREMSDLVCSSEAEDVYQLNVQFFPLTRQS